MGSVCCDPLDDPRGIWPECTECEFWAWRERLLQFSELASLFPLPV
ncbi:MAG TPA: hypothetical protein VMS35_08040 [Nitrososphaeraceae archaeon]|nr:hypothetical protein [Nitrososphaeraceae archaeon]